MSKQVTEILKEVNLSEKPRLVKCLAVHNEAEWVEANLRNCYEEFDVIRIIEGAVQGRPNSTTNGHSTDGTLDLIRSFPDPQGKIELLVQGRHFKSLEEQKQLFLEMGRAGEWLVIVDCDEFYHPQDIDRIRCAVELRPMASEIIPTFLHFYRDVKHIKAPHPEWQVHHQRILRWRPGLRYHTHPVATDAEGKCTYFDGSYQIARFIIPNLYCYHYGHAKGKAFHAMKQEFYKSELGKFRLEDGTNASDKFDEKFVEFMEHSEHPSTILEFDGKHPKEIEEHKIYSEREQSYLGKKFTNWRSNFMYSCKELPTIPLWMIGPWKRTNSFVNILSV